MCLFFLIDCAHLDMLKCCDVQENFPQRRESGRRERGGVLLDRTGSHMVRLSDVGHGDQMCR